METPNNWQVLETAEDVALKSVTLILEASEQAIQSRGEFHLVTAGGTTPLRCYQLLAEKTLPSPDKWHIYIGDERCVPVDDKDRNSLALEQTWLAKSDIPQANWHYMLAEQGAEKAAEDYRRIVDGVTFDIVMLGMGEDGHTASIFPNHSYQHSSVVTEFNSPKMPPERVSLSVAKLSDTQLVLKLITGAGKQTAMSQWLNNEDLPITRIKGAETLVLLDNPAFPNEDRT